MTSEIRLQRQHRSREKTNPLIDSNWLSEGARKTTGEAVTPEKSPRRELMERRAALLAWLDPRAILDDNEPVTIEDKDLAAVLAVSEIVPTPDGPRRRLQPDIRRAALKRMATRAAMNEVLAGLPSSIDDPIQRMMVKIVQEEQPAIEKLDRNELAGLLVVTEWMDGILDNLPQPAAIRARLARADLIAPLQYLAKNFIGRESELDQLRGYLGDVRQSSVIRRGTKAISDLAGSIASTFSANSEPGPNLFIHGIGGVGKSTLVAQFILELAAREIPFVFLDLDRPHLDPRSPNTLLAEAARQLRVQLPSEANFWQNLADDLDAVSRNVGPTHEAETAAAVDPRNAIGAFCNAVRNNASRNLPFIIDTFEIAQSLGDSSIYLMREMLAQLQQGIPQLRPILCGRVLPGSNQFPAASLPLTEFEPASAERFLASLLAGKSALSNDPAAVSLAARSVERTPLALNLTAQLLIEHGIDAVRSPSFLGIVLYTKDAAFLYNRVLDHIPAGPLRKLAKPGLVLRRLSPAIIKDVLSDICGLDIASDQAARSLFADFSRQVSLVEREPGEILRHRPDVRRLMLPALEREVGRTTVRAIDEAAVKFHARFDEPISRAEELYHRLRLSDIENFELRWRDDVAERLREAMEDFEPQRSWAGLPEARVALSLKLGLTPDRAALEVADAAHWERATETSVAVLLQQGAFEAALKVLSERTTRAAASPLFRQQAETLMGLGKYPEALAVAQQGIESAQTVGDTETIFENAHLAARACEAMGDGEGAQKWLGQAMEAAIRLGQAEKLLRAAALRSRLENWVSTAAQALPSLLPVAQGLLKWGGLQGVAGAPLLRALAAAAGGEDRIRRTALRQLGVERLSSTLKDDLATLIAGIAGGNGISAQSVRAILAGANEAIPESDAGPAAWNEWLEKASNRGLGNALAELSREDNEYGVTDQVTAWIVRYFKELAAAPEPQPSPSASAATA